MLFLTEDDVDGLLTMGEALRVVEAALRDLGDGRAENRPRQRVRGSHAVLNVMPASWPVRGYYGFKDYSASKEGIRFWCHLCDGNTSAPLAVLQADRLGQRRTGAASGIATKFLARTDAAVAGLVGTGWQAESQLEAICAVRPIETVQCISRHRGRREDFAERMSKSLEIDVVPMDSAQEALRGADIIITATDSSTPVVRGPWVEPGVHVNAIGANRIDARELDDDAMRRATFVMTDSIEQARHEAGDLVQPIRDGVLTWEQVHELSQLVAGKVSGRQRPDDVTLFKSLGIAIEDVAVAAFVYERAKKEGIGQEITL